MRIAYSRVQSQSSAILGCHLPSQVWSDKLHSLVLLCRQKDFKEFRHAKVFSKLQADLKESEENGTVVLDETVVRGTLYCIAGDHVASYQALTIFL